MKKTRKKKKFDSKFLLLAIVSVFLTAFIGSQFTDTGEWYESIKPSITPPNYVFPIVWTTLFILIAISFYLALISSKKEYNKKEIIPGYLFNFVLNMAWSFFFFKMKLPVLAFIDLILLWFSTALLIYITQKINKISSWLLAPYLLWLSFAGILNFIIAF
ncbi:MAG: tryptophan-rich sensory protein [Candidatus Pacearchaeota archaeon]|nr:tryptophan-rich sensory protein [Candidatus Pacearchaeota archaeon]